MTENKLTGLIGENSFPILERAKVKKDVLKKLVKIIEKNPLATPWENICIFADACELSRAKKIFYKGDSEGIQLGPCVDGGFDCFHYKTFFEGKNLYSYD